MPTTSGKQQGIPSKDEVLMAEPRTPMRKVRIQTYRTRSQASEQPTPAKVLGIHVKNTLGWHKRVTEGFRYSAFERLQAAINLSLKDAALLVQIPTRTLLRRKRGDRFEPDESDRILRASTVFCKAVQLFEGDEKEALAWLKAPAKGLGGETPLELVRTEVGATEVERLIGRLEHGVFT